MIVIRPLGTALRHDMPALTLGSYTRLAAPGNVFAYLRAHEDQRVLVALNLGRQPELLDPPRVKIRGRVVPSTHLDFAGEELLGAVALRPDEGVIVRFEP